MSGRVYKLYSQRNVLAELDKLRHRETLLDATEQIAHIGHCEWDYENDCIRSCSEGYARLFGMTVDEVVAAQDSWDKTLEQIHPDDRERYRNSYESQEKLGSHEIEYRLCRADGELRYIYETGTVEFDGDGRPIAAFGLLQDITERKQHELELESRDALAQQAEAIVDIGHFIFDIATETYSYISPGFAQIHGVSVDEYLSMVKTVEDDIEDVHPDDYVMVEETYRHADRSGEDYLIEYRIFRSDGEIRWLREQGTARPSPEGGIVQRIGVIQDISEQKRTEQSLREARDSLELMVKNRTRKLAQTVKRLEEEVKEREKIAAELDFLANHDALTGLPSLRLCKDRLDHSLAEARRNRQMSAVMFLDLDGFKEINDAHGHEFGDLVLKEIADRITGEIRETDTVARIGGDEFIIILSSVPELEVVERIASSLIERIAAPFDIDRIEECVSASAGIALYPEHGTTAEQLIRAADKAMYSIKRQGKNNYGLYQRVDEVSSIADPG